MNRLLVPVGARWKMATTTEQQQQWYNESHISLKNNWPWCVYFCLQALWTGNTVLLPVVKYLVQHWNKRHASVRIHEIQVSSHESQVSLTTDFRFCHLFPNGTNLFNWRPETCADNQKHWSSLIVRSNTVELWRLQLQWLLSQKRNKRWKKSRRR